MADTAEPEVETKSNTKSNTKSKSEANTKSKSKSKSEPKSKPKSGARSEAKAEPEAGPGAGSETEPAPPEHRNAPEGTRQGAWPLDDGRVRFALWAPWKQSVALVGDFNDWQPDADPMTVGDDGVWWCERELEPGTHRYLFLVDGDTHIGDPYAREVDWNEQGPHALVRVGEEPFEWRDGDYRMPDPDSWVMYEVHVGNFTPEGTFAALTERLDELAELGVNALELMPVFEFPGDRSWGYNAVYMMAPESSYGSLRDLMTLIDEAHARGMAVVLDMVFNHVGEDHPFVSLYPYGESPFFGDDTNPWGFPDLNHWSDAVKGFVHNLQDYWLNWLHIDGFRYDATAFIDYDHENGMSFIAHDAREIKPHARLIAEQVPEDPALVHDTEIDAAWHDHWRRVVLAQLLEREYEGLHYGDWDELLQVLVPSERGYGGGSTVINYLESHDHERLAFELQHTPGGSERAAAKAVLGAALLFTAPGTPMLLQGQELLTDTPREETMERAPLDRSRLQRDDVAWLRESLKRLAWLRREHPALRGDRLEVWLADAERKLLVYRRWAEGEDAEVLVMLNFAPDEQSLALTLERGGRYHERLSDEHWELAEGDYETVIPGSTARVLERVA